MAYERLTNKPNNTWNCPAWKDGACQKGNSVCFEIDECQTYHRLAGLEDKIESGRVVFLTEEEAKYYKEYKRLIKSTGSARNAFMYTMGATDAERKKQEALGFTIGAPIYVIIPGDENIYEKVCRSVTIDKDGITINGVWSTNECFTTKEAAEAKLNELRGEE